MKTEIKYAIAQMRKSGCGYGQIAKYLGIKENTIKSFCRRNGLLQADLENIKPEDFEDTSTFRFCKNCGVQVPQTEGRKVKKFCCDRCRNEWWNTHQGDVKRKAMYDYTCPVCGKEFFAYGNRNRKYCSHECYIKDRFG